MNWSWPAYKGNYAHPNLSYTVHEKYGRVMLRYRFDNVYGTEVVVLDGERFDVAYVKYSSVGIALGVQEYDRYYDLDGEKVTELLDEMSMRHMGRVASIRELSLY